MLSKTSTGIVISLNKASLKDGEITGYHLKEAAINGNMYGLIPNFFPSNSTLSPYLGDLKYASIILSFFHLAPIVFMTFLNETPSIDLYSIDIKIIPFMNGKISIFNVNIFSWF